VGCPPPRSTRLRGQVRAGGRSRFRSWRVPGRPPRIGTQAG